MNATKVDCTWDTLGQGFIVYPNRPDDEFVNPPKSSKDLEDEEKKILSFILYISPEFIVTGGTCMVDEEIKKADLIELIHDWQNNEKAH